MTAIWICVILLPLSVSADPVSNTRYPADGDFEAELQVGQPGMVFKHGSGDISFERTNAQAYRGNYSLLVTDRPVVWSGVGWDVTDIVKQNGLENWYLSAFVKAVDSEMQFYFNIHVIDSDGDQDWLSSNTHVTVNTSGWTRVNSSEAGDPVSFVSTSGQAVDVDKITGATLYMQTGDNQLGGYYIDDVTLYQLKNDGDTFPYDGGFEQELFVGVPGHIFHHGGTSRFTISDSQAYSGESSLLVTGRDLVYSGPGWNVLDYLKDNGWGDWYISAYVRAVEPVAMQIYFSIYLKYNDGTEDWLTSNTNVTFGNDGWIRVNADTSGTPVKLVSSKGLTPDFSKLEVANMYMCTGDGQTNDFYIDDVELYRAVPQDPGNNDPGDDDPNDDDPGNDPPVVISGKYPPDGSFEDPLKIGEPGYVFRHGNEVGLALSSDQAHGGSKSLLVTGRTVPYGGPGWNVLEYLKQKGWGDWYISAYVRAVDPIAMQMYFSIYVKYTDGTEDWLTSNTNVTFGNDGWIRVNAGEDGKPVRLVSLKGLTPDFSKLETATLYMCTGDNQLSDFYIDDVELYKASENPKTGENSIGLLLAILMSVPALLLLRVTIKKKA